MLFSSFKNFLTSEDGAVTVDWVVLTAAVVALAGFIVITINGSSGNVGDLVGTYLDGRQVGE